MARRNVLRPGRMHIGESILAMHRGGLSSYILGNTSEGDARLRPGTHDTSTVPHGSGAEAAMRNIRGVAGRQEAEPKAKKLPAAFQLRVVLESATVMAEGVVVHELDVSWL
eukprot:CAMPEP_0183367494 /NCGR_PEP_ID=MMETSP0164_2-20130417/92643_1 /TAXON_ID=221442 /ORGANISM="Coccolithus pelagicus ssp braarudi, Strain PLY182g" /LENGTH=110 /DNA_ID=CAMNT_0025543431 /DNA_START=22 /DNA_END=354 /DNA_ORIENTATION=-